MTVCESMCDRVPERECTEVREPGMDAEKKD